MVNKWFSFKQLRCAVSLIICACFLAVVILSILIPNEKETSASPVELYTIVIDAGHGGIDAGVLGVNTNVKESEINLSIAKKLAGLFSELGFTCVMTRESSAGLYGYIAPGHKKRDMHAREKIIKESKPSIVISIHQNKYSSPSRRGGQAFYKKGDKQGYSLAISIQRALNGVYSDIKQYAPITGDYFILNVSPCPAVIVECGFLSNAKEEKLLCDSNYQSEITLVLLSGLIRSNI